MHPRLTIDRFVAAIEGSGGIKSTICLRVPCRLDTLNRWIARHAQVMAAYEAECDKMIDAAHSVVQHNILTAQKMGGTEDEPKMVDSTDAKWYLARKGADQGFGTDVAVEHRVSPMTLADFRKMAQQRLEQVEELED